MPENQLEKIHRAGVDMIRLFIDICEKENLTYYMLGGTMLGAVRHKGYIPWDDDTDFGMPRADYEKFFAVANSYLPDRYRAVNFHNKKDHLFCTGSIIDTQKKVKIDSAVKSRIDYLGIDIFPLDGMPNRYILRELQKVRLLYCRMMFSISRFDEIVFINRTNRPWYEFLLIHLVRTFSIEKFLSPEKRCLKLEKALKSVSYEKSDYIVNMLGAYKFKELFPKSVFGKGRRYEFEGLMLNGPQDYDAYLTGLYGDYMVPPPQTERNIHAMTLVAEVGGGIEQV